MDATINKAAKKPQSKADVDACETELKAARLRGLDRIAQLRKAAEPVLQLAEVCAILGLSREAILRKVGRKQILALPNDRHRVFPAFQFRDGGLLPGIAEVLSCLDTASPFVALSFFLGRNSDWDGQCAVDLLRAGNVEPVLAQARTFLQHGS